MNQKYIFELVHHKHVPNIVGHLSPVKSTGREENKINRAIEPNNNDGEERLGIGKGHASLRI